MIHPAFARVAQSVRTRLGLNALFAGSQKTKAPVETHVEVMDAQGNITVAQVVASLDSSLGCYYGATLVFIDDADAPIPGQSYKLDAKISDNGASERWVLLKV